MFSSIRNLESQSTRPIIKKTIKERSGVNQTSNVPFSFFPSDKSSKLSQFCFEKTISPEELKDVSISDSEWSQIRRQIREEGVVTNAAAVQFLIRAYAEVDRTEGEDNSTHVLHRVFKKPEHVKTKSWNVLNWMTPTTNQKYAHASWKEFFSKPTEVAVPRKSRRFSAPDALVSLGALQQVNSTRWRKTQSMVSKIEIITPYNPLGTLEPNKPSRRLGRRASEASNIASGSQKSLSSRSHLFRDNNLGAPKKTTSEFSTNAFESQESFRSKSSHMEENVEAAPVFLVTNQDFQTSPWDKMRKRICSASKGRMEKNKSFEFVKDENASQDKANILKALAEVDSIVYEQSLPKIPEFSPPIQL